MSNWGQGAINSIGWGAGASSTTIGWGVVHQYSYGHPQTNLTGVWQIISESANAIISDGGIVEAITCVNTAYTKLLFDFIPSFDFSNSNNSQYIIFL